MLVTGVLGGGEDGSVEGESGTDTCSQPRIARVSSSADGTRGLTSLGDLGRPAILGLTSAGPPRSDDDETEPFLPRVSLNAKPRAIGDTDARFNGTTRLTEVSESHPLTPVLGETGVFDWNEETDEMESLWRGPCTLDRRTSVHCGVGVVFADLVT